MNPKVALRTSVLIGALTLMAVDLALAASPKGAPTIQNGHTGAMDTRTYHGFTPAIPGMVHAFETGDQCHESGHCSNWVASVIEANNAAQSESQNSWGARIGERIFTSLQPTAKSVGARIEHVACSERACFAEATYTKSGRTQNEIMAIEAQLRAAVSTSGWAQSELRFQPTLQGWGGFLYEGPPTNPTVDVIWVWPRR